MTSVLFCYKGDPVDYVEKVADSMQLYPPTDYLTGYKLLFDYDDKVRLQSSCAIHTVGLWIKHIDFI